MFSDLRPIQLDPDVQEFSADTVTGKGTVHDKEIIGTRTDAIDGSGPPLPGAFMDILIDPVACTCIFSTSLEIAATTSAGGVQTVVGGVNKKIPLSMKDAADAIEGSVSFPARIVFCDPVPSCDFYYPGGYGTDFFTADANGSAGSAAVTWKFVPVLPNE